MADQKKPPKVFAPEVFAPEVFAPEVFAPEVFAPEVFAHRGASGYTPENTMESFQYAINQGAQWIEADVSLLKDGTLVLFHDDDLLRLSNGQSAKLLSDITYDELKTIDLGGWFSPKYQGAQIATLNQLLNLADQHQIGLNLELKTHDDNPAHHAILAEKVAQALMDHSSFSQTLTDKLLISSFSISALNHFKRLLPQIPLGVIFGEWPADWLKIANSLSPISIHPHLKDTNIDVIKNIHEAGYLSYIYTVNDPDSVADFWSHGLNGVFTNYPDRFL